MRPSMWMVVCSATVFWPGLGGVARAQGTGATPAEVTPAEVTPATGSHRWTVESAETVGPGANVFSAQVGFPGLDLMLIHGLDSTTDVNAHLGFNYAFEGLTQRTRFEFTAQVGIRKELLAIGNNGVKLSGRFDPGILIAASPGQFGIKIPVGLELGIPLSSILVANASLGLPMFFTFGDVNAFYIPLLFGVGAEYLLQPNLAVTAKLKMGPTWGTGDASGSYFTLYALVGAAYKF